jgi:hypothetical protein
MAQKGSVDFDQELKKEHFGEKARWFIPVAINAEGGQLASSDFFKANTRIDNSRKCDQRH